MLGPAQTRGHIFRDDPSVGWKEDLPFPGRAGQTGLVTSQFWSRLVATNTASRRCTLQAVGPSSRRPRAGHIGRGRAGCPGGICVSCSSVTPRGVAVAKLGRGRRLAQSISRTARSASGQTSSGQRVRIGRTSSGLGFQTRRPSSSRTCCARPPRAVSNPSVRSMSALGRCRAAGCASRRHCGTSSCRRTQWPAST